MTDAVNPLEAAQLAIDELRDENMRVYMRLNYYKQRLEIAEASADLMYDESTALRNENAEMMRAFEKLYWVADNAGEVLDIVSDMLARR